MAMDFGKLNFAVGFNRTSAFPLDANSYFESYDEAVTAAAGAAEVGSADSAYYIGQIIIIKDATKGVGLYQISATKELVKFGQASSADELAEAVSALQTRCTTIEGKLILATTEKDGFLSKEDFAKLQGIASGAQVNTLESVKVDGTALEITDKAVNIDLAGALTPYAKSADVTAALSKKVDAVEGKGLSTNDYDDAAVAEVAKVKDKADASTVTELSGKVTKNTEDISTINGKLVGLTGAMHFIGTSTTDPMSEGGATVENHPTFASGDVCLFGNKEFVYNGAAWTELGDEGSHLTKTEAAATYLTKTDAETTYITAEKAATDIATAKNEAITAAGAAVDTKLEAYSNTAATEALIATAKGEAITEAGTAADGKITEALKSYTNTADLTALLGNKADKTALQATDAKVAANETAIQALQDVGAEKNVIQTVSNEFEVSAARELSVKAVDKSKITGLDTALSGKVDKATGQRLITADEATKLSKLTLTESGGMEVDGTISANNVESLDTWITTNRDTVEGLYKTADATKLEGVAAGAQVNVIEKVKLNGKDLIPDAEKRVDLGSLATTATTQALGVAVEAAATAAMEAKDAAAAEKTRAMGVEATLATQEALTTGLGTKQDKLTAGDGIALTGSTISIDLTEIILDGGSPTP